MAVGGGGGRVRGGCGSGSRRAFEGWSQPPFNLLSVISAVSRIMARNVDFQRTNYIKKAMSCFLL